MTAEGEKTAVKASPRPRMGILRRPAPVLADMPDAVDSGVDITALSEKLASIATDTRGNDSAVRAAALACLKEELARTLKGTRQLFEEARLGGLETARRISAVHSDILIALYDFTTTHVLRAENRSKAERLALCAVGGFGRAEMAPGSDLDLLFLQAEAKSSAWGESVTEYILYMLWDMGLKVGQSCRTIDQCLKLAREDQTILTALLDARFIVGDEELSNDLRLRFRADISKGKGHAYITEKLTERDLRHNREGNSRYVIEPNVKEGKGGLRDLHVLYWMARYIDKDGKIMDPQRARDYVALGLFDNQAADRFVRAADFLWRTRCHLHYASGRPTENLTFDFQTTLARKMGYASGSVEVAVEKFMREYFTNAREVGALTRIACAKLEQQNSIRLPGGLDRFLPRSRRKLKAPGFVMEHGRLNFADPMELKHNSSHILELFKIAGIENFDIHPDAFGAIDFRRNLIDNAFRKHPKNAQIFLDTLLGSKAPGAVMKAMNEAGVLGRYLIEFGGIVARTQFNMHHAYTVDDHTIGLVRYFDDILKGDLEKENPVVTEFSKGFSKSQRRIVYMACLLHDTGKGVGDQCIEGARLSRRACTRMGLDPAEVDTISWLIRRHLDMSETAQRRDISDPQTIADFAETVGSLSRLQMLMALTVVDIRAVGPGIWNDWKGQLLRELYMATAGYLDDKPNIAPRSRANAARETLSERLPASVRDRAMPYMRELSDTYWLSFNVTDLVLHARFLDGALESGLEHAVQTRRNKSLDITELWIMTTDRAGLFTALTGAITAGGASITGARLHTSDDGHVFDIFYLQNAEGLAFGRQSDHMLKALRDKVLRAARGEVVEPSAGAPMPSRRARAIPVTARVDFQGRAAMDVVVLEVEGRDRPGLLHHIARVLTDNDMIILSAHIEVVGAMAVDVFYLKCLEDDDSWRAALRDKVRAEILAVIEPDIEAQGEVAP